MLDGKLENKNLIFVAEFRELGWNCVESVVFTSLDTYDIKGIENKLNIAWNHSDLGMLIDKVNSH